MKIRLYAPALLCAALMTSSALTATTITDSLEKQGFTSGNDFGFAKDANGNLQFTVRDETVLQKLAQIEMPAIDVSDDDQRFFHRDDDGRYTAVVSYDSVARMLLDTKHLAKQRWKSIVKELATTAKISSMPAPATPTATGARATA